MQERAKTDQKTKRDSDEYTVHRIKCHVKRGGELKHLMKGFCILWPQRHCQALQTAHNAYQFHSALFSQKRARKKSANKFKWK